MTTRMFRRNCFLAMGAALALLLGACASSSDDSPITVNSVVQELSVDPNGFTTRITFSRAPGPVSASNFGTDGAHSAVGAVASGAQVDVTWDMRVTPNDQVSLTGITNVMNGLRAVVTSDASAPTFAITNGTQDVSDTALGGDTMTVTFSGPRVVEAQAEDVTNWQLSVSGVTQDLTGSTFDLDPATQVMSVTLGPGAGLFASFDFAATSVMSVADTALSATPVTGTASGDAVAPTLTSVEQVLAASALGNVVDFTFDKPMEPTFATLSGNYQVNDHAGSSESTLVTSVVQTADNVLRVTCSNPVVPGLDDFTLAGVRDQHGNTFAGTTAFVNSNPAVNAYTSVTATTFENAGGDMISVITDQALDPDLAVDPMGWTILVAGNPLDLATQTVSYDVGSRTFLVELDFDMQNGDQVDVTPVSQVDVDGEAFAAAAAPVMASGDATAPAVNSVSQNRASDSSGMTVDVIFSEDVDPATAAMSAAYTFTPAATILSTTQTSTNVVTLATDMVLTPGDFTLAVDGSPSDLAGNTMAGPQAGIAISSTDIDAPSATATFGDAPEGANNDTVTVQFDDSMIQAEVEAPANWSVESPLGTTVDVSLSTIAYNTASRSATVTLAEGQSLKVGDGVEVTLSTMRDVSGNAIDPTPAGGSVDGDRNLGFAHTVWRNALSTDLVSVYFTEPCDFLDDLYDATTNPDGTRYALRDAGGVLRNYPIAATVMADGLGVQLSFGFTVSLTDTLDVIGATDLAGNPVFPSLLLPIENEDATAPDHGAGTAVTALSGGDNDTVVVQFNRPMSPWSLLSGQITLDGGLPVDLNDVTTEFNGTDEVTITLSATDLQSGDPQNVNLIVDPNNPLRTAQGVPIAMQQTLATNVGGDMAPPTQAGSLAVLDRQDDTVAYVVFNEEVDTSAAPVAGNYAWNGVGALTATMFGPRTVQLTFPANQNPTPIVVQAPSVVDLAGNVAAGSISLAITGDTAAPALTTITGTVVSGAGGDTITVGFNEPVDTASAFVLGKYLVMNGTNSVSLVGGQFSYDPIALEVTIHLAANVDLDATQALSVEVSFVEDLAGNSMPRVTLPGSLVGDLTAPSAQSSFVNLRNDASGATVDVLFDEDVDTAFASDPGNWTSSGGQLLTAASVISSRHLRLTFDTAIDPSTDTLDLAAGLEDSGHNAAAGLSFDPE